MPAQARNHTHVHMHTRSAIQFDAARTAYMRGAESTGRQRGPCRTGVYRCAVAILAHPSLQQRTLCASDAASGCVRNAQGRSHGVSDLSFGVHGKRRRVAPCGISESAACGLRALGTVSTATWMTWLAWLAPQWDECTCNVTLLLKLSLSYR